MIKKSTIIANYVTVREPGTYKLVVSNTNKVFDANLSSYKYIVNFKAIPEHKALMVAEIFTNTEEVEITKLNGLTMSGNIILNDGEEPRIPLKGETVKVVVDYRQSQTKEDILCVVSVEVQPEKVAEPFSFEPKVPATVPLLKVTEEEEEVRIKKDQIIKAIANPDDVF